jgi:hypothetical protein
MASRFVSPIIADHIYTNYRSLRNSGKSSKEALALLRDDVKRKFGKQMTLNCIYPYASKTLVELKESREKYHSSEKYKQRLADDKRKRKEESEKSRPEYFEFIKSVERFEKQQEVGQISPSNDYVKTLAAIARFDFPIKGKNIAEIFGERSVRKQIRVLSKYGLVEHPSGKTTEATKKGIDYLKAVDV